MAKPKNIDWTEARRLYESGEVPSLSALARMLGVVHQAASYIARKQQWQRPSKDAIRRTPTIMTNVVAFTRPEATKKSPPTESEATPSQEELLKAKDKVQHTTSRVRAILERGEVTERDAQFLERAAMAADLALSRASVALRVGFGRVTITDQLTGETRATLAFVDENGKVVADERERFERLKTTKISTEVAVLATRLYCAARGIALPEPAMRPGGDSTPAEAEREQWRPEGERDYQAMLRAMPDHERRTLLAAVRAMTGRDKRTRGE